MVWCARESADFDPRVANTLQLFEPYGWIHWDAVGSSWHTVTGYELGLAQEKAIGVRTPMLAAFATEHPWPTGFGVDISKILGADEEPSPPGTAGESAEASGTEPGVAETRPGVAETRPGAADTPAGAAAEAPLVPVPAPPPSSGDPTTWDADHKRDEDRDDSQHALTSTRWDTQHTLDNARWDTRHTLVNARWDTSLALKRAREDAALAADMSLLSAVHGAYVAVAQGSLDRAIQRATYVTTAAGAIGTLYTAVLAARYTINHQAPARSIIPALFIGAAVAFSTWYMAFLRGHTRDQQLLVSGTGGKIAETRLLDFMEWTFSGVLARAWSLRVSVIALALGLAMLPIGMVQLSSGTTWLIGVAGVLVLILWLAGEVYVAAQGPGVKTLLAKLEARPPRLAPARPTLPPAPNGDFQPSGPPAYGMTYPPPDAPERADGYDPPAPPDVAAGPPPAQFAPLAPGPRPPASHQPASPTALKVDLRIADDRPGH